ncbi:MAG: hypothetical protein AAGH65_04945 [Pseudomonadota bacterium]
MLPITNHKVHVPHAIALAAALVGLVAAFSWDIEDVREPMLAQQTAGVMSSDQHHADPAAEPDETPDGGAGSPIQGTDWSSTPVMPLFLPSNHGGQ